MSAPAPAADGIDGHYLAPLTLTVDHPLHDRLAHSIAIVDKAKLPGADALAQETILTLIRTFGAVNALIDDRLASARLSRARLHVLAYLNRAESEVRMMDIGAWLGVSKAHVTRIIDDLEREGLVERVTGTSDRRTTLVHILQAGRQRLNQALPQHLGFMSSLLSGLTEDEKVALTHLLVKARTAALNAAGKGQVAQAAFPA